MTNPAKKGTYGYRGTTLGEKGGTHGSVGELPYDGARRAEVENATQSIAQRVTDKPFKPANPSKKGGSGVPGRTLGGKGAGVCGEYAYIVSPPAKPEEDVKLEHGPFRPSNPPKQGYNCTVFPKYQEDPLDLKLKREKEAKKAELQRKANQAKFVPASTLKSGATASILRKNLM